jgi:hypothetical protein
LGSSSRITAAPTSLLENPRIGEKPEKGSDFHSALTLYYSARARARARGLAA